MYRLLRALSLGTVLAASFMPAAHAEGTLFTFDQTAAPFTAARGPGRLSFFDPSGSGWGETATVFGTAASLGLPPLPGGEVRVMGFPACAQDQGYLFEPAAETNGPLADENLTSNYTLIFDVLFPSASENRWRAFWQTDVSNSNDGEFFAQNSPGGPIGIGGNYRGRLTPDRWHRVAIVVRAAAGEGQAQRFIDGQFVGAIGTTGSGLGSRWGTGPAALILTDDNGETAPGYLSSFYFIDRAMSFDDITALGGAHAAGAITAGPPAPPAAPLMARRVGAIGHRGGYFSGTPDNTLPGITRAFDSGAAGVEIDTRLTADGVCVLFHDDSLERTTDGTGALADTTLAELKLLDAGSWFDPSFAGTRVPTLAEALTTAKGRGIVYLDIKTPGQAPAFAEAIAASQFPVSDLWFWAPGNAEYAAEIRAAVPGAKILWGGPDDDWATNPNYWSTLRAIGVYGFSWGTNAPDPDFCAAAKREGFITEVFTLLDPDAIRTAAAAGVDFIETDFPQTMAVLQPPQLDAASGPLPADRDAVAGTSTILRWVTGRGATKHRIYFGTANPPPFVGEQASDLHATGTLQSGSTYYWKVDEVTPTGLVTGPVWRFTTAAAQAGGTIHEFNLNGTLESKRGTAQLTLAGPETESLVSFATTDDIAVPHPDGQPAGFLQMPAFTSASDGLALTWNGQPANGGGQFINNYSFVFDIFMPGQVGWLSYFNTGPSNTTDGDFFTNPSGAIGIGALGYSPSGVIQTGQWHRVVFAASLGAGEVNMYVDGVLARRRTGASLLDGRHSLQPGSGPGPHIRLFSDEDGEMSEVLVAAIAFVDATLSPIEVESLGSVQAAGIFTGSSPQPMLKISQQGDAVRLDWEAAAGRKLQRSTRLQPGSWQDVPGTLGTATYSEPWKSDTSAFFRLAP